MQGMLKAISACLLVSASLLSRAEGGAGAGGSKGAKSPSVKLPGPAYTALETITPEHICPTTCWKGAGRGSAAATSRRNTLPRSLPSTG